MSHDRMQGLSSVLLQQLWLGLSLLVAWLVLLPPAMFLVENASMVWLTIAAVICFLPGSVVLALQPLWVSSGAAGFGAMSGTVLRIVFVAGSMIAVAVRRPRVGLLEFGVELSIFYLVALGVETLLMVRGLGCAASRRI